MAYFDCIVGGSGKGNTVTVTCAEEFAGLTITLAKTGKTYTKTCPSTAPYVVTFNGVENGTYTVSTTYEGDTYSKEVIVQDVSCVLNYGFVWQTWVDTASQLDSSDYDTLDEVLADEKALRELFLEHACVDYMASFGVSNEDLETVINNDLCAKWINLSDYALDFLHANEVIADLMDEADKYGYGEWALMPQVPTMTSNTAPYGVASASSTQSGYDAYKAFDGNDTTHWLANTGTTLGYLIYQFPNPVRVSMVTMKEANSQRIKGFDILGSNDGTNYTLIYSGEAEQSASLQTFKFNNANSYSYYKFDCTTVYEARISITELQFYAWAPKGNVPVMTGNSAPYGTASASNEYNSTQYAAYRAFDNDCSSTWYTTQGNTSTYIGYKFTNPVNVKRFRIWGDKDETVSRIKTVIIRASNDGFSTYDELYSRALTTQEAQTYFIDNVVNDNFYLEYRAYLPDSNKTTGSERVCRELQFYGRELKVSVPLMTSNTAPFGVASASSLYDSNNAAWRAFGGNSTRWASNTLGMPQWVQYKFISPVTINYIYMDYVNNTAGWEVVDFKLQGSNDGSNYDDLATITNDKTSTIHCYKINNIDSYLYYRVYITKCGSNTSTSFTSVRGNLYGPDYSEKEFEAGTNKKWLYDHGVELETLEKALGTGATASNDGESYNLVGGTSSQQFCGIMSNQNLSSYSIARARVGDMVTNIGVCCGSALSPISSIYNAGYNALQSGDGNLPNNIYLNVSSINDTKYIGAYVGTNAKASLKELWLE